ncbi:hypothetical protein JHL18_19325 [Clostridium sp. YIM B02505]|uniref:Uncharacterized protein n=1 Tax=Clostridium yunnanense TaxID=2800325 RepID=A0ABS1ETT4_9CLOT|nr:hypothetical protein [Clostridium yunnanense]MBK1812777.1 hypothetical protein [Clostridium yunnanense]
MRLIDARRLDWPEAKAKGKRRFIFMRGIIPFVMADLLALTISQLSYNKPLSQISLNTMMIYLSSLIFIIFAGFFYANTIWKSNVKNFDK